MKRNLTLSVFLGIALAVSCSIPEWTNYTLRVYNMSSYDINVVFQENPTVNTDTLGLMAGSNITVLHFSEEGSRDELTSSEFEKLSSLFKVRKDSIDIVVQQPIDLKGWDLHYSGSGDGITDIVYAFYVTDSLVN